jgi:hypothetical protein
VVLQMAPVVVAVVVLVNLDLPVAQVKAEMDISHLSLELILTMQAAAVVVHKMVEHVHKVARVVAELDLQDVHTITR